MIFRRLKSLLVAVFSLSILFFSNTSLANEGPEEKFDPAALIMEHIKDGHEFHFGPLTFPLPVILYSPQRGLDMFSSGKFHHGTEPYKGYKLEHGTIIPIDAAGNHDHSVTVFDLSLTRNVVQMIFALIVLCWIMISIAKRYKQGQGLRTAPKGMQNLIEPVITF